MKDGRWKVCLPCDPGPRPRGNIEPHTPEGRRGEVLQPAACTANGAHTNIYEKPWAEAAVCPRILTILTPPARSGGIGSARIQGLLGETPRHASPHRGWGWGRLAHGWPEPGWPRRSLEAWPLASLTAKPKVRPGTDGAGGLSGPWTLAWSLGWPRAPIHHATSLIASSH